MIRLAVLSLALAAAGSGAHAQQAMMGASDQPETLEMMQARSAALFNRLDADQDGAVAAAELSGLSQMGPGAGRMRAMIARADTNNDARITREEMAAVTEARFRQMDKNGDGVITPDERPQMPASQAPAAIPMPQQPSQSDPSQWPGGVPNGG